jgi:hypothetical protein
MTRQSCDDRHLGLDTMGYDEPPDAAPEDEPESAYDTLEEYWLDKETK